VKAGDLVYDSSINKHGVIIQVGIDWTDTNGVTYVWDYEVLYSDGRRAYADVIEISPVEEACK
jgi:hypothetical protein